MNNAKVEVAIPAASKGTSPDTEEKHDNSLSKTTPGGQVAKNQPSGPPAGVPPNNNKLKQEEHSDKKPGNKGKKVVEGGIKNWKEKQPVPDGHVRCNKCQHIVAKKDLKAHNASHRKNKGDSPKNKAFVESMKNAIAEAAAAKETTKEIIEQTNQLLDAKEEELGAMKAKVEASQGITKLEALAVLADQKTAKYDNTGALIVDDIECVLPSEIEQPKLIAKTLKLGEIPSGGMFSSLCNLAFRKMCNDIVSVYENFVEEVEEAVEDLALATVLTTHTLSHAVMGIFTGANDSESTSELCESKAKKLENYDNQLKKGFEYMENWGASYFDIGVMAVCVADYEYHKVAYGCQILRARLNDAAALISKSLGAYTRVAKTIAEDTGFILWRFSVMTLRMSKILLDNFGPAQLIRYAIAEKAVSASLWFEADEQITVPYDSRTIAARHFNEHCPSVLWRGGCVVKLKTNRSVWAWICKILKFDLSRLSTHVSWPRILPKQYQDEWGNFKTFDVNMSILQQLNANHIIYSAKEGADYRNIVLTQYRSEDRISPPLFELLSEEVLGDPHAAAVDIMAYRTRGIQTASVMESRGAISLN